MVAVASINNSVRIGAAAFALGLSLTGPQAVGIAAADSTDADSPSVSADPAATRSAGPPGRRAAIRATRSAGVVTAPAPRAAATTISPEDGPAIKTNRTAKAARSPATRTETRRPTAGVPDLPSTGRSSSTDSPNTAQDQVSEAPAPSAAQPVGASATVSAVTPNVIAPVSSPAPAAAITAQPRSIRQSLVMWLVTQGVGGASEESAALASPAPGQLVATATVRIGQTFDRIGDWLTRLPANPITDFASGALLLVRRTLPSATPVAVAPSVYSTAGGTGPVLTAITSTPGSKSLLLTFDGPLVPGTATDLANYRITSANWGNPQLVTSSGPALKIVSAQYSDISVSSSQVTLTLARSMRQGTFYRVVINGNPPIITGDPNSNPVRGSDGTAFDGDNDETAGGDFYGLFAVGKRLTFTDSSGDRVTLTADGGALNVWRELNGDIDQITALPGTTSLSGTVRLGKDSTGKVYIGSLTVPVPTPLNLNGATDNLPQSFETVPPDGLTPPPVPTADAPKPVPANASNLPYTLNIAPVSAPGITDLPGLQGSVYAQMAPTSQYPSGLWVVIGGRTNGLHDFVPSGEQSFPPAFQNNIIYVINPVDWQVWSPPWNQTGVSPAVYSPLSSSDAQYYAKGDTLYVNGGYSVPGTASFTGNVSAASTTITVTSGLENLAVGQRVSGVLPFPSGQEIFRPGTTITAIDGNTVTTSSDTEADGTGVTFAAFTKEFTTYDTLTALSIKGLAQAVIDGGDVATLAKIRQMSDPRLAVTGGGMANLSGRTYLVFGHDFQGGYNGATSNLAQVYTDEIRSFRIVDTGRRLAITGYRALRDPVNYRRRDGNLVNFIGSDGRAELAYLGGVFTPGDAGSGYQAPIFVGPGGRARIDAAYQQYFSQYSTAEVLLHDRGSRSMYDILVGGISLYYYNDGVLTEDLELPWVDNVTSLVRFRDGEFQEYSMTPIRPVTPGGTGYYGAGAGWFGNQALPQYRNDVIRLHQLSGPTVLGFMYGGIYSTVAATGNTFSETGASNQVFQITLTPT